MTVLLVSGWNNCGQLGAGDTTNKNKFQRVEFPNSQVKTMALGETHNLIVGDNGKVFGIGSTAGGRLGLGDDTHNHTTPTQITALESVKISAVAVGASHSLFLSDTGEVYACGTGKNGQLGLGPASIVVKTPTRIPVFASTQTKIVSICAGTHHSLFLDDSGSVWSCGAGYHGQLGLGDRVDRNEPQKIDVGLDDGEPLVFTQCHAGGDHSLLLAGVGQVWVFGWNELGQCGIADIEGDILRPTPVDAFASVRVCSLAAGDTHSVFVNSLGLVYTCGSGQFGRLGQGDEVGRTAPTPIAQLSRIKVVHCAAGKDHTLLIDQNERMYTFGWGNYGALGLGAVTHVKPTIVKLPFKQREHIIGAYAGGHTTFVVAGSKEQQQQVALERVAADARKESCSVM